MKFFWLVYISFLTVTMTLIFFTLIFLCRFTIGLFSKTKSENIIHQIAIQWGRSIFRCMPLWSLQINGIGNLDYRKNYILVANHQSMTDILVMFCTGLNFRWIAKKELFSVPCVGWGMKWAGYIPVKRGDRNSHLAAMEQAKNILHNGVSMFFFPEGTRSKDGQLLPFKSGAFRLSIQTGTPILPVVIRGAHQLLPKGSITPQKAKVEVTFLTSLSPTIYTTQESLLSETHRKISETLADQAVKI